MATVTISKKEYRELVDKKLRYEYLKQILEEDIFSLPPTNSTKEITESFRKTGRYNKRFINSLERGLRRSSYFK